MIRRASYTPTTSLLSSAQEPLIVVEETGGFDEEDEEEARPPSPRAGADSPSLNPFLLSPYRDLRKRSLPTPQCTSGITASQVRRLSEQGGEGKGPSPMEAAFLATLSQAPAPTAGGRRHSVVTISRAPPSSILFGRNRRESIAAFPGGLPRRDSSSGLGSNFNLQLDIMDDIAEIKAARKVKLKMWQTDDKEKICEIQPIEGGSSSRYHQQSAAGPSSRRFSDVTGINLPGPSGQPLKRRASEMPVRRVSTPPPTGGKGIVCSNTDLISIMSSLTSSAQEINVISLKGEPKTIDQKRSRLKDSRSNSFDISLLPDSRSHPCDEKPYNEASNWFIRRHQPMESKKKLTEEVKHKHLVVTFADEKPKSTITEKPKEVPKEKQSVKQTSVEKVVWDKPTGTAVDAKVIGSAIEVFLNQRSSEPSTSQPKEEPAPQTPSKTSKTSMSWFGSKTKQPVDEEAASSCDNSICSTLKDLFVK